MSTVPIMCVACGARTSASLASLASLTCPTCKTGEHLDLDERTAGLDPSDPMPLLPGGVPDQDADMPLLDPEKRRKVPVQPGAPPYTQDALATPVNASRRTASGEVGDYRNGQKVFVYGGGGYTAVVVGVRPIDVFVSDREALIVRNDRTGAESPVDPLIVVPLEDARQAWHVFDANGAIIAGGPNISQARAEQIASEKGGTAQKGLGRAASREDRIARLRVEKIAANVLKTNPGMSIKTAHRVAAQAVAQYPVVKTAEDALFGVNDSPLLLQPGTKIHIGPMRSNNPQMQDMGYGDKVFEWVGPTRHPYSSVVRELTHGTTWHVDNYRITPVKEASRRMAASAPTVGKVYKITYVLDNGSDYTEEGLVIQADGNDVWFMKTDGSYRRVPPTSTAPGDRSIAAQALNAWADKTVAFHPGSNGQKNMAGLLRKYVKDADVDQGVKTEVLAKIEAISDPPFVVQNG